MAYAAQTTVPVDRSRTEIERNLIRFGAEGFAYGWEATQEIVGFTFRGMQVRLTLPMPPRSSYRSEEAWQKERRRRWRALTMVLKAKLVAVDEGILGFEESFLAWFVMPQGQTLGEAIIPRLEQAAHSGQLPRLMLPAPVGE